MSAPPRPGRPATARAPDHDARLARWRAWWAIRPGGRPSARELSLRMEVGEKMTQKYAAGSQNPTTAALLNLETLSAAYGYEPPTDAHLFL